jgi:hypothetical protein
LNNLFEFDFPAASELVSRMPTTINLSWPANPASEGIQKYQVFESKDLGPFNFKADVLTPALQILNPLPGFYRWQVRAVNFVGDGPMGPVAEGPDVPTVPGTIVVQVINS